MSGSAIEIVLVSGRRYSYKGARFIKGKPRWVNRRDALYLLDTLRFERADDIREQERRKAERASRAAEREAERERREGLELATGDGVFAAPPEDPDEDEEREPVEAMPSEPEEEDDGHVRLPEPAKRGPKTLVVSEGKGKGKGKGKVTKTVKPKVITDPNDPNYDAIKVKAAVESGVIPRSAAHPSVFADEAPDAGEELDLDIEDENEE